MFLLSRPKYGVCVFVCVCVYECLSMCVCNFVCVYVCTCALIECSLTFWNWGGGLAVASLGCNLLGSVAFYMAMTNANVSLVVPVVNAITFVVTGVVGSLLFGEPSSPQMWLGMVLILAGVTVALY